MAISVHDGSEKKEPAGSQASPPAHPDPAVAREVATWFEALKGPVYSTIFSIYRRREQADELTQETFLRLYEYRCSGKHVEHVPSWVLRVAHNLAINAAKASRHELLESDAAAQRERFDAPDPSPDPEQKLVRKEQAELIMQRLMRLTSRQRQCIQLRASGLRYRDIAVMLSVSVSAVADVVSRALDILQGGM